MLRIICAIFYFGIALCIAWQVVAVRHVLALTVKGVRHQTNLFYIMQVGPFSLDGWQILIFEGFLILLAIAFVFLGVYVLLPKRNV